MLISIYNDAEKPIYEQITDQIESMILNGVLQENQMLPSIRGLAKELRISVITTKRAYEDLQRRGLITTVSGKGSFVSGRNLNAVKKEKLSQFKKQLQSSIKVCKAAGIRKEECVAILEQVYMMEE